MESIEEEPQAHHNPTSDKNNTLEKMTPRENTGTELSRSFGLFSILSLAFCVLGTWPTLAVSLSSGIDNGGPITILWGLILVLLCNICVALSMGELCSSMPTALGQAYWVFRLLEENDKHAENNGSKKRGPGWGRFMSYVTAWINTFGWWTITASQNSFMASFLAGMKILFDSDWTATGDGPDWLSFLVYLGVTFALTIVNVVICRSERVLPMFNNFVGIGFFGLFFLFILAMTISVGIREDLHFQPASFVFATWINNTGWPDGLVWFLGLVQSAYALTAFDAAVHMAEEVPNPRRTIPQVLWMCVLLGAASGFVFMVACLFVVQDLEEILDPSTGLPFMDLIFSSIGLEGAAVLLALFIFNGLGQGVSVVTTSSRMTWGFARDGGLPYSAYMAHIDEKWKVPARALWIQGVLTGSIGVLYLFSNTVLDAILSVSTIALSISYAIPILVLVSVGRDKMPAGGTFKLGKVLGPICNYVSLVYCAITTVMFFFPSSPDPVPEDMNWAVSVFGIMVIVATVFWFVRGKKGYLQAGETEGRTIISREPGTASQGREVVSKIELETKSEGNSSAHVEKMNSLASVLV